MGSSRLWRASVLAVVLLAAAFVVPTGPAQGAAKTWTVLVYMEAEGTLEEAGLDNMLEMQAAGAGPNARVLVMMDRGPGEDTRDGDWETTRRYEIPTQATSVGDSQTIGARLIDDLGEVNLGDPEVFADFLVWGVQTAPADHYLVIPWNHGGAWDGVVFDHTPEDDHLTLDEIRFALEDGRRRAGIAQWDLVYFDACSMAALEVAHAVGQTAKYVIASEELVPGEGGHYGAMMEALGERDMTPEELAGRIVSSFAARYAGPRGDAPGGHACVGLCGSRAYGERYRSDTINDAILSWWDTSKEPALWEAWISFGAAIEESAAAEWPVLLRAANDADRYGQEPAMDVGDFAARVRDGTSDPALRDAAADVLAALDPFIMGHTTAPSHRAATGIMVHFPLPGAGASAESSAAPDVYGHEDYAGAGTAAAALLAAAKAGDSDAPMFGEITARKTAAGYVFTVLVDEQNPLSVDLAVTDEESEYGEVLAWIPPSTLEEVEDGLLATFEFDGTVLALVGAETDDEYLPIAPAFFETLDSIEYRLDGVIRDGETGEEYDGYLVFDLEGSLQSAWIVEASASEFTPTADDTFSPVFLGWEDGEPIDLYDVEVAAGGAGRSAWRLEAVELGAGATGFSAYAEDLAGNAALSDTIEIDLADEEAVEPEAPADPSEDPVDDVPAGTAEDEADTPAAPLALVLALVAAVALASRRPRRG